MGEWLKCWCNCMFNNTHIQPFCISWDFVFAGFHYPNNFIFWHHFDCLDNIIHMHQQEDCVFAWSRQTLVNNWLNMLAILSLLSKTLSCLWNSSGYLCSFYILPIIVRSIVHVPAICLFALAVEYSSIYFVTTYDSCQFIFIYVFSIHCSVF